MLAVKYGHTQVVECILSGPNTGIDVRNALGCTALMQAVSQRDSQIVEMLVLAKADLSI